MDPKPETEVREAVGVFKTADALQEAYDDLLSSGFHRSEVSLMAGEQTVVEKLGHKFQKVAELEDDPNVPRTVYVPPESLGDAQGALVGGLLYIGAAGAAGLVLASGGALAAAVAAAAVTGGTSALVGAVLAKFIGDHHAHYLQEQLDHGGILLWVRTRDDEHESRAVEVLKRHSGCDVHVHGVKQP